MKRLNWYKHVKPLTALAIGALGFLGGFGVAHGSEWMALPVPVRTLAAGDLLVTSQLAERRFRAEWVARNAFAPNTIVLGGMVALRTLPKGRPIALADIGPQPDVIAGDIITAVFDGGALQIAAPMLALEAGVSGEMVRLRNPDTGAEISGRVAGFKRVTVGP
jgi:flagellar basal body P-ring formation protein FlgA